MNAFHSLERVWADSVVDTINVGSSPVDIAYTPNNHDMYVANYLSNTVSVINSSNSVVDTITVGRSPVAIAYNSNNNDMYVANGNDNTVSVFAPPPIANVGSSNGTKFSNNSSKRFC